MEEQWVVFKIRVWYTYCKTRRACCMRPASELGAQQEAISALQARKCCDAGCISWVCGTAVCGRAQQSLTGKE